LKTLLVARTWLLDLDEQCFSSAVRFDLHVANVYTRLLNQ